jgi:hypothetical protein
MVKHSLMVVLGLSLVGCGYMAKRDISSIESPVLISLDSHAHLQQPFSESIKNGYEEVLNNPMVAHSFVLSDTFRKDDNDLTRSELHLEASRVVSKYPGRLTGFCGLNLTWSDGGEILRECLDLPGMSGVKIHDYSLPKDFSL